MKPELPEQDTKNQIKRSVNEFQETNRMRPLLHVLAALIGLSLSAGIQAEGDVETGKLRAQTCMGCHGAPGMRNAYPGYRVPKLGGQYEFYIINALKAYKQESRAHPTMQAQAAGLSPQDMEHIAAYFNSLGDLSEIENNVDSTPAEQCVACHNKDGISPSDPSATQGAPVLAGQYPDYIVQALLEYQNGKRENAVMKGMASGLSRAEMEEIAEFYYAQDGLVAPHISE